MSIAHDTTESLDTLPRDGIDPWLASLELKLTEVREENVRLRVQLLSRDGAIWPIEIFHASNTVFKPADGKKSVGDHILHIASVCREWLRAHKEKQRLDDAVKQCRHGGLRILAQETDWAELLTSFGGHGGEAADYVAELAGKRDEREARAVAEEWRVRE